MPDHTPLVDPVRIADLLPDVLTDLARAALAAGRDGYRTTTTHQRKDTV